jgi:hypothetical protein
MIPVTCLIDGHLVFLRSTTRNWTNFYWPRLITQPCYRLTYFDISVVDTYPALHPHLTYFQLSELKPQAAQNLTAIQQNQYSEYFSDESNNILYCDKNEWPVWDERPKRISYDLASILSRLRLMWSSRIHSNLNECHDEKGWCTSWCHRYTRMALLLLLHYL